MSSETNTQKPTAPAPPFRFSVCCLTWECFSSFGPPLIRALFPSCLLDSKLFARLQQTSHDILQPWKQTHAHRGRTKSPAAMKLTWLAYNKHRCGQSRTWQQRRWQRPINRVISVRCVTSSRLSIFIILARYTSLSSFLLGSPEVEPCTPETGRKRQRWMVGECLLAFLKGQLHGVTDIPNDLIQTDEEGRRNLWRFICASFRWST